MSNTKKANLKLNRESVRRLTGAELGIAAGGSVVSEKAGAATITKQTQCGACSSQAKQSCLD
jgi:hypothetical protein